MKVQVWAFVAVLAIAPLGAAPAPALAAQAPQPQPANARVGAPVDLTGQWVSVVHEDWRWRMVTPPKGDYSSIPLNAEGRRIADTWNLDADNAAGKQCLAYGPGGLVRMPMRMRISWQDDNTLKVETDAGQQTRLYPFLRPGPGPILPTLARFGAAPAQRTLQGVTHALWYRMPRGGGMGGGGGAAPPSGGSLRAVTAQMQAGYLRKNGVPMSENAVVTEQYNRFDLPNGDSWLTVTTIIDDPQYLTQPFLLSTDFKLEKDPTKWSPAACQTKVPLQAPVVGQATPR